MIQVIWDPVGLLAILSREFVKNYISGTFFFQQMPSPGSWENIFCPPTYFWCLQIFCSLAKFSCPNQIQRSPLISTASSIKREVCCSRKTEDSHIVVNSPKPTRPFWIMDDLGALQVSNLNIRREDKQDEQNLTLLLNWKIQKVFSSPNWAYKRRPAEKYNSSRWGSRPQSTVLGDEATLSCQYFF